MFTKIATIALAVGFLSAGAFASGRDLKAGLALHPTNVTTIAKNQVWPVKGRIMADPCKASACIDI